MSRAALALAGALFAGGLGARRLVRADQEALLTKYRQNTHGFFVPGATYHLLTRNCTEILATLFPSRGYDCAYRGLHLPTQCKRTQAPPLAPELEAEALRIARSVAYSTLVGQGTRVKTWCGHPELPKKLETVTCDIQTWLEEAKKLPVQDRLIVVAVEGAYERVRLLSHVTVILYNRAKHTACSFGVRAHGRGMVRELFKLVHAYEIPFFMSSPDVASVSRGPPCFVKIVDAFSPTDAELAEVLRRLAEAFQPLNPAAAHGP